MISKRPDELQSNFDAEQLFSLYLNLSSFRKVLYHLESIGVVNPYTGTGYTKETVARTMWKWVLDNPQESLDTLRKYGGEITDQDWEDFLVEKAYSIYVRITNSRKRFEKWLRKNNLYDKHKDYGRIR